MPKLKKSIQTTKCIITHPVQPLPGDTPTEMHLGAERKPRHEREGGGGAEECIVGRRRRLPPTYKQMEFLLTYTTLPDTLKPVVPGGGKGGERGGDGHRWRRRRRDISMGAPGGGG